MEGEREDSHDDIMWKKMLTPRKREMTEVVEERGHMKGGRKGVEEGNRGGCRRTFWCREVSTGGRDTPTHTNSDVIQHSNLSHGDTALCIPLPVYHICIHVSDNDIQYGLPEFS